MKMYVLLKSTKIKNLDPNGKIKKKNLIMTNTLLNNILSTL